MENKILKSMSLLSVITGHSTDEGYESVRRKHQDDEIAALEDQLETIEEELEKEHKRIRRAEKDLKALDQRIISEHKFLAKLIGKDYFAKKFDEKWSKLEEFDGKIDEEHEGLVEKVDHFERELKNCKHFQDYRGKIETLLNEEYHKGAVETRTECPTSLRYFIVKVKFVRNILSSNADRIKFIQEKVEDVRSELKHPDRELYDIAKDILHAVNGIKYHTVADQIREMEEYSISDVS